MWPIRDLYDQHFLVLKSEVPQNPEDLHSKLLWFLRIEEAQEERIPL
jgi:hypothetical protein